MDLSGEFTVSAPREKELIAEVCVPLQRSNRCRYSKVTTGSADGWPALGVAAAIDSFGDDIRSVRLRLRRTIQSALKRPTTHS
jgi:carbon-monoxide dehydrogenase medium subunit